MYTITVHTNAGQTFRRRLATFAAANLYAKACETFATQVLIEQD